MMLYHLSGFIQIREICHIRSLAEICQTSTLVEISALHMEQDAELLLFVHFAAGVSVGGLLVHERSGSKLNGNTTNVTD